MRLETLKDVLEGKVLVHAHCYRSSEILMLIRLAEEIGFKIRTFQHVLEGYKVASEIARHGAGGSTFSDWWAYKLEAHDAIPYNAAIMASHGVRVSLNSDSNELARRLYWEAAKAMKYGKKRQRDRRSQDDYAESKPGSWALTSGWAPWSRQRCRHRHLQLSSLCAGDALRDDVCGRRLLL